MLIKLTVQEFAQRLARRQSDSGGGSAAALAGALGRAWFPCFAKSPPGGRSMPRSRRKWKKRFGLLRQWQARLLELVDLDSAAYDKVLAAYRLPKETDPEKEARRQ